jgi:Flp pilus assembly pilin Flp
MNGQRAIRRARRLIVEDSGQDLTEYGLLMFLIAIVAMMAVSEVGATVRTVFWEFIAGRVANI